MIPALGSDEYDVVVALAPEWTANACRSWDAIFAGSADPSLGACRFGSM
jgi:hypothetical protein